LLVCGLKQISISYVIIYYMEPNRFLFKLTAIILQYILVALIFIPIVYAFQLLKYSFKTEEIEFIRVLFFAVALSMPFTVANAFSFAKFEKIDMAYYLKSNQKHSAFIDLNPSEALENIRTNLSKKDFWKLKSQTENSLNFRVKNLVLTDKVSIVIKPYLNNQTEITINSRPLLSYMFLDFGRNYRNIITVLLAVKHS